MLLTQFLQTSFYMTTMYLLKLRNYSLITANLRNHSLITANYTPGCVQVLLHQDPVYHLTVHQVLTSPRAPLPRVPWTFPCTAALYSAPHLGFVQCLDWGYGFRQRAWEEGQILGCGWLEDAHSTEVCPSSWHREGAGAP